MPVKLVMTSCQSGSDMIAIHGIDKDLLTVFKKLDLKPDDMAAFKADTAGALVGVKIAARYGWKAGQNVTLPELNGISFNVRGVFSRHGSADDFLIFVGRKYLQEAVAEQGISNYVLIRPKKEADRSQVCKDIDALPLTVKTTTLPEEAMLSVTLDQLKDLVRLSRWIILVIIIVVLIAVGNAISMATRDRFREFGILKTLGFQKNHIAGLVLGEGILQACIGAVIGCAIVQGMTLAGLFSNVSTCSISVDFTVGIAEWVSVMAILIIASGLGCLLPAMEAARTEIVNAIRQND